MKYKLIIRKSTIILLIALIAGVLSASGAQALLSRDYDYSAAVSKADLIVTGKVLQTSSEWVETSGGKNIFTKVHVLIDQTLKGSPGTDVLVFQTMGGTVGEITQTVSDLATFVPDEEVILLLQDDPAVQSRLSVLPGYGKKLIQSGKVSWSGAGMEVEDFIEGLKGLIQAPASKLNQHLRSTRGKGVRQDTSPVDQGSSGRIEQSDQIVPRFVLPDLQPY